MSTALSLLLLVGLLGFAVLRPYGLPEAVGAVPAAGLTVLLGLVSWRDAVHEMVALGTTVGFLAAVLLLAHLADEAGVFRFAGAVAARWSAGSPTRLLGLVFVIASVVTAALSLDATVVLLTPVVFATASTLAVRPKPHVYACNHLANSASVLLPVSNLTNLLAMTAGGLSFLGFAGLMALPWQAVIAVEYVILRRFFADDLATPVRPVRQEPVAAPRFAIAVLAATLLGFGIADPLGVHPAWMALAGALALAVPRLVSDRARTARVRALVLAANPAFCAFVLALGVVVLAVSRGGFGAVVDRLAPHHAGLWGLLGMAVLAAVLANLLNNLPATLMLLPLAAPSPGLVLAVLLGVNIGPNLTYAGSLATLLWRQIMRDRDHPPVTGEFLRLGALTVPACLVVGVAALWVGLRVSGL
jgi:arsenical pump membrane protein